MVGVFDTVKAMGLRLPLLWQLTEGRYAYHDHHSCEGVEHGVQALALDETRTVFQPVLWQAEAPWSIAIGWSVMASPWMANSSTMVNSSP